MPKGAVDEKTRLSQGIEELKDSYGLSSHVTCADSHGDGTHYALIDYEPLKLSSFRVFCAQRGTIVCDPVLLTEQVLITAIFLGCALPVYFYFKTHMEQENISPWLRAPSGHISVRKWLDEQEGKMRAFAMIMTNLAAFLLSFYTSITVTRWWAMRTGGVGGIKAASVELELLLYQNVTQDETVLSAVRRYGRTSLMLIFLWRRKELDPDHLRLTLTKETAGGGKLLEEHEVDQLLKWNHCLHETIWAWQSAIITMLHKEGRIKSDQLYSLLLQKCLDGRAAVQLVHTHLAVRVPMQYVHLLGLLVKMHNLVLAVIMGLLFGAALRNAEIIICIQLFGRTLILPFLFNAILLINAELSDPFDGSETDFPCTVYEKNLEKDAKGIVAASQNMPTWLKKRFDANEMP